MISGFNNITLNGSLSALALSYDGSAIYISGNFTTVNGVSQKYVAAVLSTDGSLVSSFNPKTNSNALAIAYSSDGNKLFLGGNFSTVNTIPINNLAAVSTAGEININFNPNPNGSISSMLLSGDGSKLYLAGFFGSIGTTSPITRNRVASILTSDGSVVSNFNPNANQAVRCLAISKDETKIYIGGAFTSLNGQARSKVAAFNTVDGTLDSTFNPLTISAGNGAAGIYTLTLSQDESLLYIGGPLSSVGGVARVGIAALNSSNGTLATSFQAIINSGANIFSTVLSPDGNTLYLGGTMTSVGGVSTSGIAAVQASNGSLDANFTLPTLSSSGFINNLKLSKDGNSLFISGSFNTVNGLSRPGIAQLQRNNGSLVTSFDATSITSGSVATTANSEDGNTIYAGGSFTNLGGQISHYFAPLNIGNGKWLPNF